MLLRSRSIFAGFVATHAGKSLLWAGIDGLTLLLLVTIVSIDPLLAGTIILSGSIVNMTLDLLWGYVASYHCPTGAILRRVSTFGAGAAVVCFGALPMLPTGNAPLAAVLIVAGRAAYALFDVPHNGLSGQIAERAGHDRMSRWRVAVSGGAVMLTSVVAAILTGRSGDYRLAMPLILLVAIASGALLLPLPRLLETGLATIAAEPDTGRPQGDRVATLAAFTGVQVVGFSAIAAFLRVSLHLRNVDRTCMAIAIVALGLAQVSAPVLAGVILRNGRERTLMAAFYLLLAAGSLALPLAVAVGGPFVIGLFVAQGLLIGAISTLAWSDFSRLVVSVGMHDHASSFAFGIFMAGSKLGLGVAAALTGWWLETAAVAQPSALWMLATPIASLCLICVLLEQARCRRLQS